MHCFLGDNLASLELDLVALAFVGGKIQGKKQNSHHGGVLTILNLWKQKRKMYN